MSYTRKGFTLVELILYIALVSIFMSGAIYFAWDIIYGGKKSGVQRELNQNIRLASKRIIYEIRNASLLRSVSATSICLASATPSKNPTRIYLSGGFLRIAWGGGSVDCTSMTNDQPLTSNLLTVTNLLFTNKTSGSTTKNITFSITVSSTGTRKEWQKTESYTGTAELRSN